MAQASSEATQQIDHVEMTLRASKPPCPTGPAQPAAAPITAAATVPIASLKAGDSPRLKGADKAHVARLAETEDPLPPILVEPRTMRVIDGMHRVMAALLQGRETIDVIYFDSSPADAFLRAVQENVVHGLPLSQAERQFSAERIIESHPHLSDRAISRTVGLAAKTVAMIRRRMGDDGTAARVGSDGRSRPLNAREGRRRAAELMIKQPRVPLREVARAAGISPATALDVRHRLERGEAPLLGGSHPAEASVKKRSVVRRTTKDVAQSKSSGGAQSGGSPDPDGAIKTLLRDPSLRSSEQGRAMLRLVHINSVLSKYLPSVAKSMPPHAAAAVVQLALNYAKMWEDFARELNAYPWGATD